MADTPRERDLEPRDDHQLATGEAPPGDAPDGDGVGDEEWTDPDLRWKLANEAWLQAHWKIVVPIILVVAFCCFILPWVFLPWLPALGIQLFSGGFIYLGAKRYTTAFDR